MTYFYIKCTGLKRNTNKFRIEGQKIQFSGIKIMTKKEVNH